MLPAWRSETFHSLQNESGEHSGISVMTDPVAVALLLFVVAGGGICVIDALIIRRLRRQNRDRDES